MHHNTSRSMKEALGERGLVSGMNTITRHVIMTNAYMLWAVVSCRNESSSLGVR